jgi:hypothetical protein
MKKLRMVCIKKTPNGDTRSIQVLDRDLVLEDTRSHIDAVQDIGESFIEAIRGQLGHHDYTKLHYFEEFFQALSTKEVGAKFKEHPWWAKHLTERHHLNDSCPDDVNLIDIIEMLIDCNSAGIARTGIVYPIEIPEAILKKAVHNTSELIKACICVKETNL